jgi:hypothetical protein
MSAAPDSGPETATPVSLRALVDEVDGLFGGYLVSINLTTGEVREWPDRDALLDYDGPPEDGLDEPPWVVVPTDDAEEDWRIMRDFAYTRDDPVHRQSLVDAVEGARPFHRVRETIRRLGIDDAWYEFRRAGIAYFLRLWLLAENIPFRDDDAQGATDDRRGSRRGGEAGEGDSGLPSRGS